MKAIILDDDPLVLSLVANVLHRRGYKVESYSNPSLCPLYAMQGEPGQRLPTCPQLIITDFDMPHVNGVEFIEALYKTGYRCPHIALISRSSMPPVILKRLVQLGVKFFAKPFHADQIKAWLDEIEASLRSSHDYTDGWRRPPQG